MLVLVEQSRWNLLYQYSNSPMIFSGDQKWSFLLCVHLAKAPFRYLAKKYKQVTSDSSNLHSIKDVEKPTIPYVKNVFRANIPYSQSTGALNLIAEGIHILLDVKSQHVWCPMTLSMKLWKFKVAISYWLCVWTLPQLRGNLREDSVYRWSATDTCISDISSNILGANGDHPTKHCDGIPQWSLQQGNTRVLRSCVPKHRLLKLKSAVFLYSITADQL